MKKTDKHHQGSPRKLGLDRETLRRLDTTELHDVQAGYMLDLTAGCGPRLTTKP